MPVLLRTTRAVPPSPAWDRWAAVWGTGAELDPVRRMTGEAEALAAAFPAAAADWYGLARQISGVGGAPELGHMPSVAPNASDFGLMLTWTKVVASWAAASDRVLVLCDDPWMFRYLAAQPGVSAGRPPGLILPRLGMALRGLAARAGVAVRVARAALALRSQRAQAAAGGAALLVYGHPGSNAQGGDAYFGPLMAEFPRLGRALHVDCMVERARSLAADGRSFSLHAFGCLGFAFTLPFARWRALQVLRDGPYGWLIRRAEAREGATGTAAMVRWQIHCQSRWLEACRPRVVAWPWENHGWERAFVRAARTRGVATIGYQHSVVGAQKNISARGLADPERSLPDVIVANGPSGRDQLEESGVPAARLRLGGTLRFKAQVAVRHDPAGPVFLAVPFDRIVAAQMVEAVRPLTAGGLTFLVKDHPLHPFAFTESPGVTRTTVQLEHQPGVRAVVFAATTVGLEAALAGLPTARFLPRGCIALDILPKEVRVPAIGAERLGDLLELPQSPAPVAWDVIFALPDMELWRSLLGDRP